MELVRSNAQGELSPLEIGLHALECVQLGNRWSENGGLTEYAKNIGRTKSAISMYRSAAEVYLSCSDNENDPDIKFRRLNLMDKAGHLTEIHKAPPTLWSVLVTALLAKGWSVKWCHRGTISPKKSVETCSP